MSASAEKQAKALQFELLSIAKKYSEQGVTYKEIVGYLLNIATILSVSADIPIVDNVKVLEQLYNAVASEDDHKRD